MKRHDAKMCFMRNKVVKSGNIIWKEARMKKIDWVKLWKEMQ